MGKEVQGRIALALTALLLLAAGPASAQKKAQTDSLVRLVKAHSIELIEKFGRNYRKTVEATFLHNGTYLVCDTALWNVDGKIINCWGHVQLIQDQTVLTSEKLDYYIDEDLAQFRGRTVQLRNKKNNILRTRNLDYNTKDSIAVFRGGGAMRDEDGQIIESREGTYESSKKLFTFKDQVNMYTDSVFVKTSDLIYDGERKTADFIAYVDFWKDGNMLSAGRGWYNRADEIFFFEQDVHGLSEEQETWSDSLYFYRIPQNVLLLGNAHIQDTSRHVAGMADYIFYEDTLSLVTMKGQAAVAMRTEQENNKHKIDTLYMGADSIRYITHKMCDIPDGVKKAAEDRIGAMYEDPVNVYRRKAAEEAAKAAAEAAKNDPNAVAKAAAEAKQKGKGGAAKEAPDAATALKPQKEGALLPGGQEGETPEGEGVVPDGDDKGEGAAVSDSLKNPADSVRVELDTTKVGFLTAVGNVKLFRKDMQVRCDSLQYCDLDSIARFYIKPIVWNDGNRQYTADSLAVLIKQGGIDRASLMSNAFIITQEDSLYFDQIKGSEVMAYFDTTSALRRFDALGGATAMFFLTENDEIATVNKVESKMLSAILVDGDLDRVYYFDAPKNDAYPIVQLNEKDLRMKDFNWDPDSRPKGRRDITSLEVKPTERDYYESRPRAQFTQTEIYFPGYMKTVYAGIEDARRRKREARRAREAAEQAAKDSLAMAARDSSTFKLDSLQKADLAELEEVANEEWPEVPDSLNTPVPGSSERLSQSEITSRAERTKPEENTKPDVKPEEKETPSVKPDEKPEEKPEVKQPEGEVAAEETSAEKPDAGTEKSAENPESAEKPDAKPAVTAVQADTTQMNLPDSVAVAIDSTAIKKALEKKRRQEERWAKQMESARIRKEKEDAQEEKRRLAIAERDAKWAALDSLDAAKKAVKDSGRKDKQRARTRRAVLAQLQQDARDQAKLERYIARYQKQKARRDAREAKKLERQAAKEAARAEREAARAAREAVPVKEEKKPNSEIDEQTESQPSGERAPEIEPGGKLQTPVKL